MRIIVGIGNPGDTYASTRHNVGFRVVDRFARRCDLTFSRRRFNARVAEGSAFGRRVLVVKPRTYVNESGGAVAAAVRWHHAELDSLLVVLDDFNLSVGRIKISAKGSAGGHHGMASVIEALGTREFPRLRIGIGVGGRRCDRDFVLSRFTPEEETLMTDVIARATDAVGSWLREDMDRCMERINRREQRNPQEDAEEESA